MSLHIIGNPVSPYVRKIFIALLTKSVGFDFDPITPFFGNDEFTALSPLRRIPVLVEERADGAPFVLNDSTVIGEYIEDRWPDPALFPADPATKAKARWIEEYADSRIGQVFIWDYFYQKIVAPLAKQESDTDRIARAEQEDMPAIMDWIEQMAPETGFLFGDAPMLADYSVQAFFVNAAIAGWQPDAARWPKAVAWLGRVGGQAPAATVGSWVHTVITSRRDEVRPNLAAAGASLWAKSYAAEKPRRGILPI